ncbi:MAG: acetyltransferase, partial [Salinivirgaceae bacterium]|nr:acetyltransferase [Salinivirgaceae bacterium]
MINQLLFRLFQLFVFLISITPIWVLHLKSSFVAFLLYRVVGYRKKVVIGNLQKCFPEKNTKEVD